VGSVADILRFPVLRSKTLIMYFNWFASSFMLYGLALNWQHLTGQFKNEIIPKSARQIVFLYTLGKLKRR
jgi:OCT family organic cation transporter-like MFS transporter 4/5